MFIFKGADWKPGVVAAFVFWYAVFDWNVVDYPSYHKGPCYSPNHAFYVTRHQTPWQALTKAFQNDFGTVRVFDQGGNLLHEQEFSVDDQSGPMYLDRSRDEPARKSEFFICAEDRSGWEYLLPEPTGQEDVNRNCY